MSNLGKIGLIDLAVLLAKDVLPKLATKGTSSILDKLEKKVSGRGAVRAENRFNLFISNENIGYIIKIVKSPEIQVY